VSCIINVAELRQARTWNTYQATKVKQPIHVNYGSGQDEPKQIQPGCCLGDLDALLTAPELAADRGRRTGIPGQLFDQHQIAVAIQHQPLD
jgi:hypothetical protein